MSSRSADCVVVGGGIGGAVLALILGRAGKHVILLEREAKPLAAGRPEVLAQSTLGIFQELGVGNRILNEAAIPLQGLELYRSPAKLLLHFDVADFKRAGAQPYSTDPARTREILLEAAAALGSVELRRGMEVREVIKESGRIQGVRAVSGEKSFEWRAPLVIGDDGGRSRIREALGIQLKVREFPFDFLGAAGPEFPHGKSAIGQAWLEPRGLRTGIFGGIFLPQPARRTACVFILFPEAREHLMKSPASEFYGLASRLSPRCETMEQHFPFPQSFTIFRRPFGHAFRYVADGSALLGDAAHPVTPAGGQGANMSVADAVALGKVALEAFRRNDFSAARLSAYEKARRPANQRSLQFSRVTNRIFRTLKFFPGAAGFLLFFLNRTERNMETKTRFLQSVSTAFR